MSDSSGNNSRRQSSLASHTNCFPRPGKVEIVYHPVMHVKQLPNEEARACARRETERLSEIIRSAL